MSDDGVESGAVHAPKRPDDQVVSFSLKATTLWKSVSGVLLVLLVASVLTSGFSEWGSSPSGAAVAPLPSPSADPGVVANPTISLDGAHVLGSADAPVTIVEYSDFECPFCERFYTQTELLIRSQYVDTGKVKIIYKNFPLDSIHPDALPAALASECAAEQGKFWEFHDFIFENQGSLSSLSANGFSAVASSLGLDVAKFSSCVSSQKFASKVSAELQEGVANGVRGTPAFFVNGKSISGAQPFSVFDQLIKSELSK